MASGSVGRFWLSVSVFRGLRWRAGQWDVSGSQ